MILKRILKKLKSCAGSALNLIMPPNCLICNKIIASGHFCSSDFNKLRFITNPACIICDQPFSFAIDNNMVCATCISHKPAYDKALSVLEYDEFSKKFIFALKYQDQTDLSHFFSKLIFNKSKEILGSIDFVTPIALHKKRLQHRKYNHSALIAKDFAKMAGLPIIYDLLIRHKNTKPQSSLNKIARQKNIKGAFKFNEKYLDKIKGKNIAIIDDVITTGATIDNYCKILRKSGVGKIYVLTLAKTIID